VVNTTVASVPRKKTSVLITSPPALRALRRSPMTRRPATSAVTIAASGSTQIIE
jgi:hypothetical protein